MQLHLATRIYSLRLIPYAAPQMYNLRKRKAEQGKLPAVAHQPKPRGLATASEQAPLPQEDEVVVPAAAAAAVTVSPAPQPGPTPTTPAAPRKRDKKWEDVGLKVDTSRFLLGMGMTPAPAPSPKADAALVCSSSATQALTCRGFTMELLEQACRHVAAADAKIVPYIEQYGPPERLLCKAGASCFASLAKSIVFQQLATAAAAAIYGRVLRVCQCDEELTPGALVAAPVAALRGSGLSERKVSYLLDLCRHFQEGHLSDERIAGWDDAALQASLTKVKGIGAWTCDMFAMFHLGHPDVLPVGDLGVRRGMQSLYGLKDLPDAAAMGQISDRWRPFRSIGCYYMWRVEVPRMVGSKGRGKKQISASSNSRAPL